MSALQLVAAYALILVVAGLSRWRQVGIERDIFYSSLRAAVQLVAMGYVIQWVFDLRAFHYLLGLLSVMLLISGRISAQRGKGVTHAYWIATAAIAVATVGTLGLLLALGVAEPTGRFVIPLGGMILGNAMNITSQTLNRFLAELRARRTEVETLFSLGASRQQAARELLRETVRAAMIAPLDTMKAVGLIHIPGVTAGMILAGTPPIDAVRYQIVIMYMMTSAVTLSSLTATTLCYLQAFTPDHRLR